MGLGMLVHTDDSSDEQPNGSSHKKYYEACPYKFICRILLNHVNTV